MSRKVYGVKCVAQGLWDRFDEVECKHFYFTSELRKETERKINVVLLNQNLRMIYQHDINLKKIRT